MLATDPSWGQGEGGAQLVELEAARDKLDLDTTTGFLNTDSEAQTSGVFFFSQEPKPFHMRILFCLNPFNFLSWKNREGHGGPLEEQN